jgi:hypothetical protein
MYNALFLFNIMIQCLLVVLEIFMALLISVEKIVYNTV